MTTAPMAAPAALAAARPAVVDHVDAAGADEPSWLTATVRPAGSFGATDAGRLRALLDALSGCASLVVLDLSCARLRSGHAANAVDDAARALERNGGCLVCVHADEESRMLLSRAGGHAVLLDPRLGPDLPAPHGGRSSRRLRALEGSTSRRAG